LAGLTLAGVPRYFFDTRDGACFVRDDTGLECAGIEGARDAATGGLADMAKDAIPGKARRELTVEVRGEDDSQVLRASLWFEVQVVAERGRAGFL
jgi:hypothetical protein